MHVGNLPPSIEPPKSKADSPDLEDWAAKNHLLVTWIKLTIKPKLPSNISHKEITKDLWNHIKKRFALKSGACYQQLRASLENCRQVGSSVEDYFGRFTRIRNSMAECLSTKTCNFGKCECNLVKAHEKERETICIHDFLFGLDDIHGSVRSEICVQIPLPDLDTLYQTIVQNETVQLNAKNDAPAVLSFVAQAPSQQHSLEYARPTSTP